MWIFAALVLVPIVEIALFIEVGGWLTLWPTLAIVVATALVGSMLLRSQGRGALMELQRRADRGEDPTPVLAHGAMILVSGLLLLTPGFFTDTVGLLLLIPAVRAAVIARIGRSAVVIVNGRMRGGPGPDPRPGPGDETIEAEWEEVEDDPRGRRPH